MKHHQFSANNQKRDNSNSNGIETTNTSAATQGSSAAANANSARSSSVGNPNGSASAIQKQLNLAFVANIPVGLTDEQAQQFSARFNIVVRAQMAVLIASLPSPYTICEMIEAMHAAIHDPESILNKNGFNSSHVKIAIEPPADGDPAIMKEIERIMSHMSSVLNVDNESSENNKKRKNSP